MGKIQLSSFMNTKNNKIVLSEVKKLFCCHYPGESFKNIKKRYKTIRKLFNGKFPGYKPCNTEYHDLNHTQDGFLASARLIFGYNFKEEKKLSLHMAVNLLTAALFHDTGYIQEEWDNVGTGAKYTKTHIGRSIAFLMKHSRESDIDQEDVAIISKLIRCTGLNVNLYDIPFNSDEERIAGLILGTADILGQMSDRVYLEKLLFLYYEFKEAGMPGFDTEFDIIKNTIDYYETTQKRLNKEYMKVYEYAKYYFKERFNTDQNLYLTAINKNINYVKKIIEDNDTNFRHKLKRGNYVEKNNNTNDIASL